MSKSIWETLGSASKKEFFKGINFLYSMFLSGFKPHVTIIKHQ
jgi:hypothetical protein